MNEDKSRFEGDVLFVSTADGGDIVIEEGLVKDCRNFDTAAFLSLFGGNENDRDGREKETWWGNLIPGTAKDEWIQSEFSATVAGFPLTASNIQKAKSAAEHDLAWIKSDAGADGVSVSLFAESAKRVALEVKVTQEKQETGGGKYEFQWQEALR